MHPSVGPWAEANALYVEQSRLAERLKAGGPTDPPLRILDLGLGAAANAAAAILCARALGVGRRPLVVESYELFPEPLELALEDPEGFPFLQTLGEAPRTLLRAGRWEEPGLTWRLHPGDLRETLAATALGSGAELVFHDPFSPETNPDLWTPGFLQGVRACCAPRGAGLYTYSAATPTRVSLLLAGFFVGYGAPIGTKKETTVAATDLASLARPLGSEWLGRWRRSNAPHPHGPLPTNDWRGHLVAHPQFQP
jgi:tRNA U34 5-methylaminomethyl-2-thiouridine-forming methyltransferase MnmC